MPFPVESARWLPDKSANYFPSFLTKPGEFLSALTTLPSKSALNFFRMSLFRFKYSLPSRTCQVLMSTGNGLPRPTP